MNMLPTKQAAMMAVMVVNLIITGCSSGGCGGGGGGGNGSGNITGGGEDDSERPVIELGYSVSGTVAAPSNTTIDSDVNDPSAAYTQNDSALYAQAITNPVMVGGYVNVEGAGSPGRSHSQGDRYDYYHVTLDADDSVVLSVSEHTQGDADLYLWDETGSDVLDFSLSTGPIESLSIDQNGTYVLEVHAYTGASNYVLSVGQSQLHTDNANQKNFVPGHVRGGPR